VRLIAAKALIQRTSGGRQIKRLPAGNVFDEHHGIRDAVLRTDNQPLQIAGLVRIGIANLRIFGDGKAGNVGLRST
jgi:hypothetical protein